MPVDVGQEAPDFTLKDPNNEDVSLSSFRGDKNVVLVFFPLAFSGVCTTQLTSIGHNEGRYAEDDAQVLGVSVDSHYAQAAFADSVGLRDTKLLADFEPKGEVARRYGVYLDKTGFSNRAVFVIDKDGIVRSADIMKVPTDMPDEEAVIASVSACNT